MLIISATWSWRVTRSEVFTVQKQVEIFQQHTRSDPRFKCFDVPVHKIWVSDVPLKVQFFVWSAAIKRISTMARLQRLGFWLASKCVLCGNNQEDDDHLLWNCTTSACVWNNLRNAFDHEAWDTTTTITALQTWKLKTGSEVGKLIWPLVLHAGMWIIWGERNGRIFREECRTQERILKAVKTTIWSWISRKPIMRGIFFDIFMVVKSKKKQTIVVQNRSWSTMAFFKLRKFFRHGF